MKIQTSELISTHLDWAVAKCQNIGRTIKLGYGNIVLIPSSDVPDEEEIYTPSVNWEQAGKIIDEYKIGTVYVDGEWQAGINWEFFESNFYAYHKQSGPTALIAAMRSCVSKTLGDEVEIPVELEIKEQLPL